MEEKIDLTMKDFARHFEANKLGQLWLQNYGFISLARLYKEVTGWKLMNHQEISSDDILAIIAYGSAVRYPNKEIVPIKKKKYVFFGPEIEIKKEVQIRAKDTDFFVLTKRNLTEERYIPLFERDDYGYQFRAGGMHLTTRGIDQLLQGVEHNDTVSINAIKEGVPVFYEKKGLEEVVQRAGIKCENPSGLYWNVGDEKEKLTGWIGVK